MKAAEAVAWFDEVSARHVPKEGTHTYHQGEAVRWITEAESALRSVFPPGHAVVRRWDNIFEKLSGAVPQWRVDNYFDSARAVFESARAQLKQGRIAGLVDSIRAESVGELLDQAEALLASKYFVAAVVTAGGALETFLKHLCEKNGLAWAGAGSITRYEQALAQARNAGNEIVSANHGKLVTGWGGMRNTAAHTPGQFNHGEAEVRMMIEGIREFVARHA